MDSDRKAPDKADRTPFEKFVAAILAVPKSAVEQAEAKREKKQRGSNGTKPSPQ